MKTNKTYITLGVIVSLLFVGYLSVEAMNYYGRGYTKNSFTKEFQNYGNRMMGNRNSVNSNNESHMIANITTGTLSKEEENLLYYQYNEEKVAHDLYTEFYTLYKDSTFDRIAQSEQKHMDAVKTLLDRYNLAVPTDLRELQNTFDTLKAEGLTSLQKALEVGIKVEMLDIEDIVKTIKVTDNDDIKTVLLNIGGASYNHLRGFANALSQNNLSTQIDYSSYLSADEVNQRGGALKDKLLERLESEGMTFSDNVKNNLGNCDNETHSGSMHGENRGHNGNGNGKGRGQGKGMGRNGNY